MQLRRVDQYRSPGPRTGGGSHHNGLRLALAGLVFAAALALAGCGSSSGRSSASDWLPNLKSLGFVSQTGDQALINGDKGSAVALYTRTNPNETARVDIALYGSTDAATTAFTTTSTQLSALPPGLFGPNATQQKGEPLKAGDSAVSYVTAQPDGSGNHVWTDTYRFGKAVAVVFVIAKDESSAGPIRQTIADQLGGG